MTEPTAEQDIVNINETELIKFNVTDQTISELKEKYKDLTTQGPDGYLSVKAAIKDVSTIRINLEKFRVEKKAPLLAAEKYLDSEARRITALLVEIETPLKAKKKLVDDIEAKIKQEKFDKEIKRMADIQEMINKLMLAPNISEYELPELGDLEDELQYNQSLVIESDVFQEFENEATGIVYNNIQKLKSLIEKRIAYDEEQERLTKQKADQDAADKLLADERAKFEAEKAEQQRIDDAKQKKLDDEQAAINSEKQRLVDEINERHAIEQKKIDDEAIRKQERVHAAAKAERDKRKAIDNAAEKKLADERREQLRVENLSDSEFLLEHHAKLLQLGVPEVNNKEVDHGIRLRFDTLANYIKVQAETLGAVEPVVVVGTE